MDELIFVYGTLKRGGENHYLLEGSRFAGEASINGWEMRDLGDYPAITKSDGGNVHGEMYIVSDETFLRISILEGYPSLFQRMVVKTNVGWSAWVYYMEKTKGPIIESGRWNGRKTEHRGN
jgi:gamma-glutamylcyclotransferase (GGCT)/AIG2-like uncharacterized protein YtfP